MYKLLKDDQVFGVSKTVRRLSDNAIIPFDLGNTDYQEYLEWVADGNTPEAAD